ncbi:uncharacterized protein LOC143289988 isoform X3 [Babylonia areolata]|uniref:uncharacterized protein LOC143289988 isoform X3 n=1 Tax=Babylonia areolata TaxID=304850 RepID=UPI003FD31A42
MAMNYHDEARIKQERLNRWKQEKERSDAGPSNQYVGDQLDQLASKEKTDRVLTTDPGQFRQISTGHVIYSRHYNALNVPPDSIYALIHPPEKDNDVSARQRQKRNPHLKV